ncbi:DUF1778 domain-containing protein [Nonomuraea sp. NPDC050691]|uniref:type II toxin -antitoxin system TacA 1-like antitoxin n=1 Tax=Nonomuraea sp. NPDC050691 TaxID=3155661 RepID=UPI0033DCC020
MSDAEQPPKPRRRTRERGQGQRGKRVNLRLSDAEHDVLEKAAALHRTTLAGYASTAALSAARDELPPVAREAMIRLLAMQRRVVALRTAHEEAGGTDSGELADSINAMRQALEETIEEFINISRKARGQRARWTPTRFHRTPAPPQPAPSAAPRLPSTAREWIEQLAELTRQLEDSGTTLASPHWNHRRLYDALVYAVVALGHAHPGGLDRLQPRR